MDSLGLLKKIAIGVLITAAVVSLLLVGQIKVATYLFDSKLEKALTRVEKAVPGLDLSYVPGDNSFTVRQGRLMYKYPLKPNNNLGVDSVSGAVDLKVGFGPLRVTGALDSVSGVGNIEEILRSFNVDPIAFTGSFRARAVTPRVDAYLKTDSFLIPTSTGICKFGQNAFSFMATSQDNVDVDFSSAGIICEGTTRYNDKPNYRLDLLGVDVKFLPRIVNNKPHFDSLIVNVKQLDFKFSTLYAIGFGPDEEVRDPSLQEAISFANVSTLVSLSQPDKQGMSKLTFDNSGNYSFAFPYIQYNEVQPFYNLNNFKLAGSVDGVSIARLFDAAKSVMQGASAQFDTSKVFKEILHGFTKTIAVNIDQFGFSNDGRIVSVDGLTHITMDDTSSRPHVGNLDANINIKVNKSLVEQVAGDNYAKALQAALTTGQISDDGLNYKTILTLDGKNIAMNDIPVQGVVSQDDLLYEEEQRALEAQLEQERADAAALQAEIEAAKQAQQNLPSVSEGNLNADENDGEDDDERDDDERDDDDEREDDDGE